MSSHLLVIFLFSSGSAIIQSPPLVVMQGQPVTLNCFQKNTKYINMYWYKQERKKDTELQLVVFSVENSKGKVEKPFQDRFVSDGTKDYALSISVANAQPGDSGTYYCAKQDYSQGAGAQTVYFGAGTKLTVLEPGQEPTPPKVTIFAPSQKEIEEKQAATLVCLATDFIPDHVNISWYLYGTRITEGVKTEEFSKYHSETKSYSLTSRLRVSKQKWQDSYNQFQCKVKFYVNDTVEVYGSVISSEGCDTERVTYQREGYIGRFVYILLILKSTLYGVFVMSLMLRKKSVQ